MPRSAALRVLILAITLLVAVGAVAAPAPVYRPRPTTPWVTGWDKPVDPLGHCRFTKAKDKLRIFVPGEDHGFPGDVARLTAPHLLREVEGDFDVQVRVMGDFSYAEPSTGVPRRGAGILITDGRDFVRFGRMGDEGDWLGLMVFAQRASSELTHQQAGYTHEPTHFRVERRKRSITFKWSTNGRDWRTQQDSWRIDLPKKLKVGVFAEGTVRGVFTPVFDQFELTPVK